MDVGINDDMLNGIPIEDSGSESEGGDLNDDSDDEGRGPVGARKDRWEQSQYERREGQRAERKEEVQKLRSKLLMVGFYISTPC